LIGCRNLTLLYPELPGMHLLFYTRPRRDEVYLASAPLTNAFRGFRAQPINPDGPNQILFPRH
jgi:hypothetical protein